MAAFILRALVRCEFDGRQRRAGEEFEWSGSQSDLDKLLRGKHGRVERVSGGSKSKAAATSE